MRSTANIEMLNTPNQESSNNITAETFIHIIKQELYAERR